jgi:hypothetical protein
MADPIEDGGTNAAVTLASVVDATFHSPPDDAASNQEAWERGVRWAAWVRDLLTVALDDVQRNGRGGDRLGGNLRPQVDSRAVAAAQAALASIAPSIPRQKTNFNPGAANRRT